MRRLRPLTVPMIALAALAAGPVIAAEAPAAATGFYGGVAVRDLGAEQGMTFGTATTAFGRFEPLEASPTNRATAFGGYRFRDDLALEASVASTSGYRLHGRGGVGLMLPSAVDAGSRQWNVDVVGAWSFWRSLSLYGRLGYAQSELAPAYRTSIASPEHRPGEGLQVGVGLRYDFSRAFGLQLEYARVGNPVGELERGPLPDVDQLQFGVRYRF
jgi:predicted porin